MTSEPASASRNFDAVLPRKHVAAGCLFLDELGRILLVKPVYKQPWEIPGGGVEADESPLAACRREVREELGIDRPPGRLLCVDHRNAIPDVRGDALRFIFAGAPLSQGDLTTIQLDPTELSEWRFVAVDALDEYVIPALARRLRACIHARAAVYLEEGEPPATA
jgi:8-oxo-dGTP pyrophosphatase MutT (NUDIX family)